jgi:hypothetical protein
MAQKLGLGGAVLPILRAVKTLETIHSVEEDHLLRNQAPGSDWRGLSMRARSQRRSRSGNLSLTSLRDTIKGQMATADGVDEISSEKGR